MRGCIVTRIDKPPALFPPLLIFRDHLVQHRRALGDCADTVEMRINGRVDHAKIIAQSGIAGRGVQGFKTRAEGRKTR